MKTIFLSSDEEKEAVRDDKVVSLCGMRRIMTVECLRCGRELMNKPPADCDHELCPVWTQAAEWGG